MFIYEIRANLHVDIDQEQKVIRVEVEFNDTGFFCAVSDVRM